ncbi:MAG: cytidylate kinase-like family protein [Lachnospiraceae bacterium]|nr:cytidylate kinase-like family protein [Lachnospiraceae bacterium]
MSQLIISIGRECGSGGHEIAQKLSEIYNIPLYDRNILKEISDEKNLDHESLAKYDEVKKKSIFARRVRGLNNCPAHNVAQLQFEFLRKKANAGESFVVVGRCAETILKGHAALVSVFVLGDRDAKVKRVMEYLNNSWDEAAEIVDSKDEARKQYHNSHCNTKWGDSRNYDLSINSSRLGIPKTLDFIVDYINTRKS